MDHPYRVEVVARVGRITVDAEIGRADSLADLPDVLARLTGRLYPRVQGQVGICVDVKAAPITGRNLEYYRWAREDEARRLLEGVR